jgi:hypothetical protein
MELKQISVKYVEENDSFRNWCTSGGTVSRPRDEQTRTPSSITGMKTEIFFSSSRP